MPTIPPAPASSSARAAAQGSGAAYDALGDVERAADAVEDTAEHVRSDVEADRLGLHREHGIAHAESGRRLEHLDDHAVLVERRHAPEALIEYADLVTEMKLIKHPFDNGTPARKGIEY